MNIVKGKPALRKIQFSGGLLQLTEEQRFIYIIFPSHLKKKSCSKNFEEFTNHIPWNLENLKIFCLYKSWQSQHYCAMHSSVHSKHSQKCVLKRSNVLWLLLPSISLCAPQAFIYLGWRRTSPSFPISWLLQYLFYDTVMFMCLYSTLPTLTMAVTIIWASAISHL